MTQLKQFVAPVGTFLALSILLTLLTLPYFRDAERESGLQARAHTTAAALHVQ